MPAVANPVRFSENSSDYGYRGQRPLVSFDDLPINIGRKKSIPTSGIPSYGYKVGTSTPFRPGVSEDAARSTPIRSSFTVPNYNVMENAGMNEYGSYDMPGTGEQIEEMLKGTIGEGLVLGGIGTAGAALLGKNLTGMDIGNVPILKDIPFIGRGFKELDYFLDPSWANAKDASGFFKGTGRFINDFPDIAEDYMGPNGFGFGQGKVNPNYSGGPVGGYASPTKILSSLSSGLGSLGQALAKSPLKSGGGEFSSLLNADSSPAAMKPGAEFGDFINYIRGKPSAFGGDLVPTADKFISGKTPNLTTTTEPGFMNSIGNFFNQSRSFIPGVSGTGASATGFGGAGQAGSGITSIGNVLGAAGGLLSLADFVKDPSLASGLGTLAGAGASGIGAFSGLATAAPYLAFAALAAGLLMNKKPSNKTGYASVDFDNLQSQSYSIGDYKRKKMNKENVEFTKKLLDPIIPYIDEIEKKYGFDLKGDLQISYGGRDGLFYNIGNIDQEELSRRDMFLNRVDYYDGRDQNVYKRKFNTDETGLTKFYNSILKDLENIAQNKITNLRQYKGIQRQAPQGVFSYGANGGGMVPGNIGSMVPGNVGANAAPTTQPKGKQGVFSWGYGD